MKGGSPYDEDHAGFDRQALARLVVCDHAARLADLAAALVSTRNDRDTGIGGRASQSAEIVAFANELLSAAVVFERERGESWETIGRYVGLNAADIEAQFAPALDSWRAAMAVESRHGPDAGRRVSSQLRAVHDPAWHVAGLDQWASRHLTLVATDEVSVGLRRRLSRPGRDLGVLAAGFRDTVQQHRVRMVIHDRLIDDRVQDECRYLLKLFSQIGVASSVVTMDELRAHVSAEKMRAIESLLEAAGQSPADIDAWAEATVAEFPMIHDRGYTRNAKARQAGKRWPGSGLLAAVAWFGRQLGRRSGRGPRR